MTEDVIQSCKDLLSSHCFAIEALPAVIALHESDHEGRLILRCAAIVSHTAMAVLFRTLSQALVVGQGNSFIPAEDQAPPTVYRRRCRKSLKDAIKITRGLADTDFPFIDVVMSVRFLFFISVVLAVRVADGTSSVLQVCWFQISAMTTELDNEDVAMGVTPDRESPPPPTPLASKSPTIRNDQPVSRADQIRQQQAQYHRERQQSPPASHPPQPSFASVEESISGLSSVSPPHQATISEIYEDEREIGGMTSIDAVAEELSDLELLDKSTKQLQASFWRPIPDHLTNKMHRILENLQVVMENQEGVYYV